MMIKAKTYTISKLGKAFGLSRSTLLYYDKKGLLPPSGRTQTGYRYYSSEDYERLKRIVHFRDAGLSLDEIRLSLNFKGESLGNILESRLQKIGMQIRELKNKQRLLTEMFKGVIGGNAPPDVDKKMWVEMLQAAGMDDDAMDKWHKAFEKRAPEKHHEFLLSLGISENEVIKIREWSRLL